MPHIDKHVPGSFCWIELATTDQNAAKTFYDSLFGWSAADYPMGPTEFYTMFKLDGKDAAAAYTMRPEQRSQGVPPHWMLYISVESADAAAKKAGELGATILAPPFDVFTFGRMSVIKDPTGAIFSVWQPLSHIGAGIAGVEGTLCWADLSTADVDKAKQFYSDLFGWNIAPGEHDTSGYLHIQNGKEFIGGIPPAHMRNPNAPPHWLAYFLVSDCDASASKAKELGGKLFMEPTTIEGVGRMSVIADAQGAVFSIFQPMPRA
jgi:predicted enzyme related to lactoylglutathione lyase